MFFLQQIQKQLIAQCISYQEASEAGPRAEEETPPEWETPADIWGQAEELAWDAATAVREAEWDAQAITAWVEALESAEVVPELSSHIEPTSEELAHLFPDIDPEAEEFPSLSEAQRGEILTQRLQDLSIRELQIEREEWEIETILESAYIAEIAEEAGIDPQLLMDLRAVDFQGANGWDEDEIMENYSDLLVEAQRLTESEGIDLSEMSASEFIEFYETINQNDSEAATQTIDPAAAAAMWIDTRRDPAGGFQINPESPWYRQAPGGTVVGPAWSPASTWGQVYQWRPSEISPDAGNITYDTLTGFTSDTQLTESQVSELRNPEHQEIIETRFPSQWYWIAIEFMNTAGNINPEQPIALASCPNLIAIVSYPGQPPRIEESPISIGRGGYGPSVRADHDVPGQRWDGRTQTWRVQNFNSVTIAWVWQRANPNAQTITGAEIRSPEGQERWGRWWHGGREGRFPGQNSLWCVVAPDEFMIRLAEAVNRHGWGYGFQSEQATLPPQSGNAWTSSAT